MQSKTILALSTPLIALLIIVSSIGLFTPGFYSTETLNWQAQSVGQDMVDLFVVAPCLVVVSFFAFQGNRSAALIWGGLMLYITYTFVLYCFEVHFNKLFPLYCFTLGLSFYSLIYFLFGHYSKKDVSTEKSWLTRVTAVYLITIAVLFYFLWLSEIIPSIVQNKIPKSVLDAGLFTNGVQVIDLAVILPGIFMTGIFLLKNRLMGFSLAPAFLSFFVLMDITIGTLTVTMKMKGIENDLILAGIMVVLALISLLLLIGNLIAVKATSFQ